MTTVSTGSFHRPTQRPGRAHISLGPSSPGQPLAPFCRWVPTLSSLCCSQGPVTPQRAPVFPQDTGPLQVWGGGALGGHTCCLWILRGKTGKPGCPREAVRDSCSPGHRQAPSCRVHAHGCAHTLSHTPTHPLQSCARGNHCACFLGREAQCFAKDAWGVLVIGEEFG